MRHSPALRRVLCALVLLLPCAAQTQEITNVQVAGATPTQAILSYQASDQNPCTIEVSESPGFAPLVPDVDPALFSGADQDQRPGNVASDRQRVVVIGKRAAEIAVNGRRYSRALQTNTAHYYRITCGSSKVTGSFLTANIPIGKTYGDVLPADRDHPGQYAWPEMLWSDPHPRLTDPLTGLLYQPLTRPTLTGQRLSNQAFQSAVDLGGGWVNPAGALNKNSASYSGFNQSWLYLRTRGFSTLAGASWTDLGNSLNYFQIAWTAWGTALDVCLTVNGVSCASAVRQVKLSSRPTNVFVGTQDPNLSFWTDATHSLNRTDAARRTGTVSVDASGVVTYISGDNFNLQWTAGSRISIGNTECLISNLGHDHLLAIDPASCALSLPVQSATYTADNFGVLVRKSSTGAGTVTVQSAAYQYGAASEPGWASGAHTLYCADQLVADTSDPVQYGYHCSLYGALYWINSATGEARFLGVPFYLNANVGGDHVQGCWVDAAAFDPANPNRFYCLSTAGQGQPVILRGEYTGDHTDLGTVDLPSDQIQATWTNLTPASQYRDLKALVARFDPNFDPVLFANCIARGATSGGKLLVTCQRGSQDTLGWEIIFDAEKAQVVAAYQSWDKQPGRWCKLHSSASVVGSDSWVRIEFAYNRETSDPGGGAWQSRVTSGAIAADALEVCPSNTLGVSGMRCLTVTVQGEPCDATPGAGEGHNCPYDPTASYLMDAAPGDIFQVDQEWMRLLAKNGNQWLLERNFHNPGIAAHADSSNLMAMCTTNPVADLTLWNFQADPHGYNTDGTTVIADLTSTSHSSVARESIQGSASWRDCPPGANGSCLSVRTGSDVSAWISQPPSVTPWTGPKFAGQPGVAYENFIESYSTFPPTSSQAPDRSWFLYNRPLTSDANLNKLTPVNGQLYQVSSSSVLHRKVLPTLAMCGVHPLVDASGPASVIKDDSSDAFRYCVAARDGECTDASASRKTTAGDIFVNCPAVGVPLTSGCTGTAEDQGVCIADNGSYVQSVVQVSTQIKSNSGQDARVLTNGFRPYRAGQTYWNSRVLPDGSWALLWTPWFNLQRAEAFLAKLPPFPAPDGVDRSSFQPIELYVSPADGASSVVVDFGYAENGSADQFFCTSRQEACVRGDITGTDYAFASETIKPAACKSGCTVQVPAIPARVLYFRARYFDDNQQEVLAGPMGVTVVP